MRPDLLAPERVAFDVPEDIAYFNTAMLAPQLRSVRAAGIAALERRARPWAISAADWFGHSERLRWLFARIVGGDAEGIALVPATSYGFAVAARNQYPSGVHTWRAAARRAGAEVLTVAREPGQSWTEAVLAALDERVAIVSVPNVHWTDGALVDLAPIAMPLDVGGLRPDFLMTVGYKWLLGPFSLAYLYVAEEHRGGEPLEENWIARAGSEDFARLLDGLALAVHRNAIGAAA